MKLFLSWMPPNGTKRGKQMWCFFSCSLMVRLEGKEFENIQRCFFPTRELIALINLRIAKWALIKKEFSNFSLDDILHNWEACMGCGMIKIRKSVR